MKEYQDLIGKTLIAIAIVVAALLIAGAISGAGSNIFSALSSRATAFAFWEKR